MVANPHPLTSGARAREWDHGCPTTHCLIPFAATHSRRPLLETLPAVYRSARTNARQARLSGLNSFSRILLAK